MSFYSTYTCGIPDLQAFNHSYIRGSHCNHSPRNVPSLPYTYLGAANPNYQMYPGHKMYLPRQESSKNNYNTGTECSRIPNIETVLRAQVQDYITLGLEKQITEVSTTKESTKILQKWLKLHRNNPYPSKTEKVILAYSTRMTITQISNWFGNARRRIKQQKSCDKSHDSLLESSYDENLHRSLQENAQMIKSSVISGHPKKNETTPETDQKIIDNSFQTSLNDTYVTPDSGLESFTESGGSLQSKEDGKNDLKGEIKCKTNLFGTDPIPDVTVESLEAKQNTQDVLKETATEITHSKTKIWSITDILNTK